MTSKSEVSKMEVRPTDAAVADHDRRSGGHRTEPARVGGRLAGEEVAALVRAAAAGDRPSFDALVREYRGLVSSIARAHRLGDADTADLAQATWLKLFENLGRLEQPARVGAWLATTARRECLRVLRHARRQVPFADDTPDDRPAGGGPGDALMTAERNQILWGSFARLRQSDQKLLAMLMAEPRPAYEEISAVLDVPIGSIGPTRARALSRLRRELVHQNGLSLLAA